MNYKIMIIEDDDRRIPILKSLLAQEGYDEDEIFHTKENDSFIAKLNTEYANIHYIFLDYDLNGAYSGNRDRNDSSEDTIDFLLEFADKLNHIGIIIHSQNEYRVPDVNKRIKNAGFNTLVMAFPAISRVKRLDLSRWLPLMK